MRKLRVLISVAVLVLLPLGYAASQYMALGGSAEEYARRIDCPPVQWLALALLVVCVVLAFIRDEEANEK
jgi:hypothetical protein